MHSIPSPLPLDECTRRRLAVEIGCDPRTIAKLLRGERVRGLVGHRARAALIRAGLLRGESTVAGVGTASA